MRTLLLLVFVSAAARADSACLKDAERYCARIPIGEGRILTCLQSRWSDLSSACQQEIQAIQNKSREIDQACMNDVWQYCGNVAPGGDRIKVCLWSHWDQLSSTCRDMAAAVQEKKAQLQQLCPADIQNLCPGMTPGGGRIYLCLKAQESKVSVQCRQALR